MKTIIRHLVGTSLVVILASTGTFTSLRAQAAGEGSGSGLVGSGAMEPNPSDTAKAGKANETKSGSEAGGTRKAPQDAPSTGPSPATNPE